MIKYVKDDDGTRFIVDTEEVALLSKEEEKGREYSLLILKSGESVTYNLPIEVIAEQIFEDTYE